MNANASGYNMNNYTPNSDLQNNSAYNKNYNYQAANQQPFDMALEDHEQF